MLVKTVLALVYAAGDPPAAAEELGDETLTVVQAILSGDRGFVSDVGK